MATVYYITIKSEKITQNTAYNFLNFIKDKRYIREFDYSPSYLSMILQGIPEGFSSLLKENDISHEEIEIESEFERVYRQMQEEYFEKLPSLREYDAILRAAADKNAEEVEIVLSPEDWGEDKIHIMEKYFKLLWGKYNFNVIDNKIIFKENKF